MLLNGFVNAGVPFEGQQGNFPLFQASFLWVFPTHSLVAKKTKVFRDQP